MVRPPYPAAVRLCGVLAERWDQISAAYYHPGYSLLDERPHMLLNLVYAWCIERIPPDKLDEWISDLHDLLPWQDSTSSAAEELESASFMNMMAKGQG